MRRNGWDAQYLFGGRNIRELSAADLKAAVETLLEHLGCVDTSGSNLGCGVSWP